MPAGLVYECCLGKRQQVPYTYFIIQPKVGNTFGLKFEMKEKLLSACEVLMLSIVQSKSF